jgi:urea transport system substrate-binding protein
LQLKPSGNILLESLDLLLTPLNTAKKRIKYYMDQQTRKETIDCFHSKFYLFILISLLFSPPILANDNVIKVGILHSLSGTMAISEAPLKDTLLMLIKEQNKKGGLLGKKLEAVVVDPASNWPLFAKQTRELIKKHKVASIFGTWTSVSRKLVLPELEKLNGLLFYPVQYEGEESSRNIFYTGATPNQQAIPAVDYLMKEKGIKRWILVGTDYIYPQTTNKILKAYLLTNGVSKENIIVQYTPFGHSDWAGIVSNIKIVGQTNQKTAVISTINGDANVSFYQELSRQGITPKKIPVVAFSVGEQELSTLDTRTLVGHLASWNYFMSESNPQNKAFIQQWRVFTGDPNAVTNDPMEATMIGFKLWVKAVEKVQTTKVDQVIDALVGLEVPNLSGSHAKMLKNHHITKPVLLGEIQDDGQFKVVWKTKTNIAGDAWSNYLEKSKDLVADWTKPVNCGSYNIIKKSCQTDSIVDWISNKLFNFDAT